MARKEVDERRGEDAVGHEESTLHGQPSNNRSRLLLPVMHGVPCDTDTSIIRGETANVVVVQAEKKWASTVGLIAENSLLFITSVVSQLCEECTYIYIYSRVLVGCCPSSVPPFSQIHDSHALVIKRRKPDSLFLRRGCELRLSIRSSVFHTLVPFVFWGLP